MYPLGSLLECSRELSLLAVGSTSNVRCPTSVAADDPFPLHLHGRCALDVDVDGECQVAHRCTSRAEHLRHESLDPMGVQRGTLSSPLRPRSRRALFSHRRCAATTTSRCDGRTNTAT